MTYRLWLDDVRTPPPTRDWFVCRSYDEAADCLRSFGFPRFVSFDHDLGDDSKGSGMDFAKLLVTYDLTTHEMPEDFDFDVHSANPCGAENIKSLLDSYLKSKRAD